VEGNDIFDSVDYTICYSASNDRNLFGTGFLVHKRLRNSIIDFVPVDERICCLRIKGNFFNTTLICVHAPTEDKDEIEKNSFYDNLNRIYHKVATHDFKIIMGDMNAKVGKVSKVHNVGIHSLHEVSNDNGIKLIDFAISRNMVISSVRFPYKYIHKESWISPDGHTRN
jgi:hypothetical protein